MEDTAGNYSGSKKDGDWILELFAPSYASVSDALEINTIKNEESKVKFVSAYDPQSIKNVYERVHMMLALDAELKAETSPLMLSVGQSVNSPVVSDNISKDLDNTQLRDSNIWNAEELSVLRDVFRSARSQLQALEVRLQQSQEHNAELEEKVTSTLLALEKKSAKLSDATKANHRLKIHCDDLQMEQKAMQTQLDAVTEMWKEIDGEKSKMIKESHQLRIALDKERLHRQQLQLQLEEAQQQATREKRIAEETIKARFDERLMQMEKQMKLLKKELVAESEAHAKDKKALEHLRAHFASLPLCDILPSNVVIADQVKDIDHL